MIKNIILILSIILNVLVAGFVGFYLVSDSMDEIAFGGVFYKMCGAWDENFNDENRTCAQIKESMELFVEKKKVEEEEGVEESPNVKALESEVEVFEFGISEFEWDSVGVGDVVKGWEVVSVGPFMEDVIPFGVENIIVGFEGQTTLTGEWNYQALGDGMGGEMLCFSKMDEESQDRYPWMVDAYTTVDNAWFCFSNLEQAKDMFGIDGSSSVSGLGIVEVSDLNLVFYPSEVFPYARLDKVVKFAK